MKAENRVRNLIQQRKAVRVEVIIGLQNEAPLKCEDKRRSVGEMVSIATYFCIALHADL